MNFPSETQNLYKMFPGFKFLLSGSHSYNNKFDLCIQRTAFIFSIGEQDLITLIQMTIIVVFMMIVFLLFRSLRRNKHKGMGSFMTLSAGSTYEAMTEDRKRAAEEIIERNAGKKMESQSSAEPGDKD